MRFFRLHRRDQRGDLGRIGGAACPIPLRFYLSLGQHGRLQPIYTVLTVTIRGICATQRLNFGAATIMSRRVKKPLRPAGDRPKGARPYRGSAAERPQAYRPGGKPPARSAAPRAAKPAPFVPEPEKVVAEAAPL